MSAKPRSLWKPCALVKSEMLQFKHVFPRLGRLDVLSHCDSLLLHVRIQGLQGVLKLNAGRLEGCDPIPCPLPLLFIQARMCHVRQIWHSISLRHCWGRMQLNLRKLLVWVALRVLLQNHGSARTVNHEVLSLRNSRLHLPSNHQFVLLFSRLSYHAGVLRCLQLPYWNVRRFRPLRLPRLLVLAYLILGPVQKDERSF